MQQTQLWTLRARKLVRILRHPDFRQALAMGIAATVEHSEIPFDPLTRTVLDVGANRGQFAAFALHTFPLATVHAFEPLPAAAHSLQQLAGLGNSRLKVRQLAIGSRDATGVIHEMSQDDSSSFLRPLADQRQLREVGEVNTAIRRLDSIFAAEELVHPVLLKVDVQGCELDVLEGAGSLIDEIDDAFVEISFVEFYQGQALANDVIAFAEEHGLRIRVLSPTILGASGHVDQADALFTRRHVPRS